MATESWSKAQFGSDVIVDMLQQMQVEYVALNPGATFRGVHDSLVNYAGTKGPEMILCTHEEIAVAVAHGYGKAAGKPMAAYVHNVVGLLHSSMAVFNAWCDRAGLLLLGATGPMDASSRRPWIDWIHTANVQGEAVRNFTKWDDQPASIAASAEAIIRAHHTASSDPKGPVYLCFDAAIQEQKLESPFLLPDVSKYPKPTRIQADALSIHTVVDALVGADSPVIVADFLGRSTEALEGLVRLAEALGAPVIDGGDLYNFPTRHHLYATESKKELIEAADVVLALDVYDLAQAFSGAHYASRDPVDLMRPDAKLIDVSLRQQNVRSWAQDYGRLYPTSMSVTADTAVAVPAIAELVQRRVEDDQLVMSKAEERRSHVKELHVSAREAALREAAQPMAEDGTLRLGFVAQKIWETIKDVDWVLGNGDLRGWVQRLWDFTSANQNMDSRGGGGLGQGFGHAIGVALANRDQGRVTINIQSDGDLLFTPSAIWTAVHHRIPMLVVMYNNRTYGNDLGHQALVAQMRGRPEENKHVGINIEDPHVDFSSMARSFGAWAEGPIELPEDLGPALERALKAVVENGAVALVDVITEVR